MKKCILHKFKMSRRISYAVVAVFCFSFKNHMKAQQSFSSTLVINAAAGDPDAQVNLAECYLMGKGVEKNANEALRLLRQAAEKGNAGALCILGTMYFKGENVEKDPILSEKYLLKAANTGYPLAQMLLGDFYARGFKGEKYYVPQNNQKSEEWFRKAEQQGYFSKQRVEAKEASIPAGTQVLSLNPKTAEADTKKMEEHYEKEKTKILSEAIKDIQNDLNNAIHKIATEADELKKQTTEKILESEKRKIKEETDKATNPQ